MSDDALNRDELVKLSPEEVTALLRAGKLEHLTRQPERADDKHYADGQRNAAWLAAATPAEVQAALLAGELNTLLGRS
jgi:hypothetical protein